MRLGTSTASQQGRANGRPRRDGAGCHPDPRITELHRCYTKPRQDAGSEDPPVTASHWHVPSGSCSPRRWTGRPYQPARLVTSGLSGWRAKSWMQVGSRRLLCRAKWLRAGRHADRRLSPSFHLRPSPGLDPLTGRAVIHGPVVSSDLFGTYPSFGLRQYP